MQAAAGGAETAHVWRCCREDAICVPVNHGNFPWRPRDLHGGGSLQHSDRLVPCRLAPVFHVPAHVRHNTLIFPVPELIAGLSAVCPLLPGDLIFTGTPAGIGAARTPPQFLRPGDVLVSWIEGVGSLRNAMVASPVTADLPASTR